MNAKEKINQIVEDCGGLDCCFSSVNGSDWECPYCKKVVPFKPADEISESFLKACEGLDVKVSEQIGPGCDD